MYINANTFVCAKLAAGSAAHVAGGWVTQGQRGIGYEGCSIDLASIMFRSPCHAFCSLPGEG